MQLAQRDTTSFAAAVARWGPGLLVVGLTGLGFVLRLAVAHQSLFADELSTYWIVSSHGVGGVVSVVHTNAEITPPLYFVLARLTTRIAQTPEMLRAPSLVAGVATVPLTYLVGVRTIGRGPAAVGAVAVTLSPFMIFFSSEARAYAVMIALVLLSALAILLAVETGRRRWWTVYAVCAAGAVYTHYTSAFALAGEFLWVLWAHPPARRRAVIATSAAAVAFLPWLTGFINDLNSPTTAILAALEPFNVHQVRLDVEHWLIGYPFVLPNTTLRAVPGILGLVLLASGAAAAVVGLLVRYRAGARSPFGRPGRGFVLVAALALSAPVGEAFASGAGADLFGARNLAVAWPGFALLMAGIAWAGAPPFRIAAIVMALAGLAIAAGKMLDHGLRRPDYGAVARAIDREARPSDVVVDAAALTPGPLSGLDVALGRHHPILRVSRPQERDHPFTIFDPIVPTREVARRALEEARGGRLFIVGQRDPGPIPRFQALSAVVRQLPPGLRLVERRAYPGILDLTLRVYADARHRSG